MAHCSKVFNSNRQRQGSLLCSKKKKKQRVFTSVIITVLSLVLSSHKVSGNTYQPTYQPSLLGSYEPTSSDDYYYYDDDDDDYDYGDDYNDDNDNDDYEEQKVRSILDISNGAETERPTYFPTYAPTNYARDEDDAENEEVKEVDWAKFAEDINAMVNAGGEDGERSAATEWPAGGEDGERSAATEWPSYFPTYAPTTTSERDNRSVPDDDRELVTSLTWSPTYMPTTYVSTDDSKSSSSQVSSVDAVTYGRPPPAANAANAANNLREITIAVMAAVVATTILFV
jgi:hypothetical protein